MANGYVGVPASYTPVEYIESSGTQWINTGVLAYNTEMSMRFQYTNLSAVTYVSGSSDGTNRFGLIANRPTNNDICYGDKSNNYYTLGTADTNEHTVVYNNSSNQIVYDNVVKGTLPNLTTQVARPLGVFALSGTNGASALAYVRIMYCRIKDKTTNELIRDFIPVLDDNNVACMYEQVEGRFYYNAGSGTFIAGSTIGQPISIGSRARKLKKGYVGIPTSYTPVEYIESSGTQYIDTEVVMTSNVSSEIDFQLAAITSAAHNSIITSFVDGTQKGFVFAQRNNNSNFAYAFGAGWNGIEVAADLTSHIAQVNLNGKCYLDNQILVSTTGSAGLNSNLNILLCAWHNNGGPQANRFGYLKIYSCKIWDGNTLVRDFIPVTDDNNVACMYEQVEGKFYYNNGTGTFAAGQATGQPVLLSKARKIKKGYVGVNGVARLCWSSGYSWEDFHQFLIYCKANVTTYRNAYMPGVINTLVNNWATLETKMQEKGVSTDGYKNFWLNYSGGNNHPVIQMSKEDVSYECSSNGYWTIPSPTTYLRFDFNYNDVSSITETTTEANYSRNSVGIFSTEPTNGNYYTTQLQNIWIR